MAKDNRRRNDDGFEDRVVNINRVAKTVKGGRNMRFSALVVVGNRNGKVGYATGKAAEVPAAIRKAVEAAKKNIIDVPISGTTIPHQVEGEFAGGRVLLKPAEEGSGVAAGGSVRAVMELGGITDVTAKSLGSDSATNMVAATFEGIKQLKSAEEVARLRGKSVEEILG